MPLNAITVFILPAMSGYLGGVISQLGKTVIDYLWKTDCYIKFVVEKYMISQEPIEIDDDDIIKNEELINEITEKIKKRVFGVFILAAPTGTGKSILMKMVINSIKSKEPQIKIKLIKNGGEVLLEQCIHDIIKVPAKHPLSDYLPKNSIIVLDQVDFTEDNITTNLKNYLVGLATDSSNSKKYKIILCISNGKVTNEILKLNGGEKFLLISNYNSLKWSEIQLKEFIKIKLAELSNKDREEIFVLANSCHRSPGLICQAYFLMENNEICDENWNILKKNSKQVNDNWNDFNNI